MPDRGVEWELTAVYASPKSHIQGFVWEKLDEIEVVGTWAMLVDFNCVLQAEERNTWIGA